MIDLTRIRIPADAVGMNDTYQLPQGAVGTIITKAGGKDRVKWKKEGQSADIFEMLDSKGRYCLCEVATGQFYIVTDIVSGEKKQTEYHCYTLAAA